MNENRKSEIVNPKSLRIVFMGTPEFAVTSLDALVQAGFGIVGVVTAPDKPSGRGMKINESAVKKFAEEKNLKILQPEKLKSSLFLDALKSLQADIFIVVAFRMLPEVVWNMPTLGTINLHASLLPQYRGASPINWVIINGEKETGVTTFKLQQEIDTGNILLQEKIKISENETAGDLRDKMKKVGAALLVKTIKEIADGTLKEISQKELLSTINHQPSTELKTAPKIFTETCKIDWNKSADEVYNLIRGLSPYPAAFSFLNNKMLKIYSSKREIISHSFENGNMQSDGKTFLKFACSNGFIHVLDLQLEGKKRMLIEDFLRGYKF